MGRSLMTEEGPVFNDNPNGARHVTASGGGTLGFPPRECAAVFFSLCILLLHYRSHFAKVL